MIQVDQFGFRIWSFSLVQREFLGHFGVFDILNYLINFEDKYCFGFPHPHYYNQFHSSQWSYYMPDFRHYLCISCSLPFLPGQQDYRLMDHINSFHRTTHHRILRPSYGLWELDDMKQKLLVLEKFFYSFQFTNRKVRYSKSKKPLQPFQYFSLTFQFWKLDKVDNSTLKHS